jgi:hypothetical protein
MIPSSTIDFDVVEARQNGQSTVCGKSFVLIHLSRQIELDERPPGGDVVCRTFFLLGES